MRDIGLRIDSYHILYFVLYMRDVMSYDNSIIVLLRESIDFHIRKINKSVWRVRELEQISRQIP